jgi:hypothetical protein
MFKQLVSNLPFSPSLIGQLGFYANRLRKETSIRRLGLIFTALALIIQIFAMVAPPQSSNAASANDVLNGGCDSKECLLSAYDTNRQGFRTLIDDLGITRAEIAAGSWSRSRTIKSTDWPVSFGRQNGVGNRRGTFKASDGTQYYWGALSDWDTRGASWYYGLTGYSARVGAFVILGTCGNPELKVIPPEPVPACPYNPSLKQNDPNCKPKCQYNNNIFADDPNCKPPAAQCNAIGVTPATKLGIMNQTDFSFTTDASANYGATINGFRYDYRLTTDSQSQSSPKLPASNSQWTTKFASAGTWNVRAIAETSLGDKTSDSCLATITVNNPPDAGCKALSVQQVSRTEYKLTTTANVVYGATIKGYHYVIKNGDKTIFEKTVDSTETTNTLSVTVPDNKNTAAALSYNVSVDVLTSVGNKSCASKITIPAAPDAQCKLLTVKQLSRTKFELSGAASIINGATIKGYEYVIKDAKGKVIKTIPIDSNEVANKTTIELPANNSVNDTAKYTISLTVKSSAGDKTSEACAKTVEIPPLDKCEFNPELPVGDPNCKPKCEYNSDIFQDDKNCVPPEVIYTKSAFNVTQNTDATKVKANGSDVISWTITATNNTPNSGTWTIKDELSDILEYAALNNTGGGTFDATTKTLSWADVTIPGGQSTQRTFTVNVTNPVPTVARGNSLPTSYDCTMTNLMDGGVRVDVPVNCSTPKAIEQIVTDLPNTGAGTNILFGGIVLAVVVFFYARSRQLGKEVRLVRKDFNAGTL